MAFALSSQEAGAFLSMQWHSGRRINGWQPSNKIAQENLRLLGDDAVESWLRSSPSTENDFLPFSGFLDSVGDVALTTANFPIDVRPALWVKSEIFNP